MISKIIPNCKVIIITQRKWQKELVVWCHGHLDLCSKKIYL